MNLNAETGEPIIVECIQKLEKHSKEEERLKDEHLIECLNALTKECEKVIGGLVYFMLHLIVYLFGNEWESHE